MGTLKVVIGASTGSGNPLGTKFQDWHEESNWGWGSGADAGHIITKRSGSTVYYVVAGQSPEVSFPDPPDPAAINGAIASAVATAVASAPQGPNPIAVANAIAAAVQSALSSLPTPPTPADIAAAVAAALGAAHYPVLPLHATLVGDPAQPLTAKLLGDPAQPVAATLNAPDLRDMRARMTAELTTKVGGTPEPIKVDPVDLSLTLNLEKLPRGRLLVSLPSLWFGLALFGFKIIGFQIEAGGTLEAQSTADGV